LVNLSTIDNMTQQPVPYRFLAAAWLIPSCAADGPFPNSFPPLEGTKAAPILDDVPGCACQGNWCKGEEKTHFWYSDEEMDHGAICPFLGSAYNFLSSDFKTSGLVCDELQASDNFRRAFGDLGNTGFPEDRDMDRIYYNAGGHLVRVESGNCQTAYERQQQCFADPSSYYSTARWYPPHPTSCSSWEFSLPTTDSKLAVASACLSSFENIDGPSDDSWLLYASWSDGTNDDVDFCRYEPSGTSSDVAPGVAPASSDVAPSVAPEPRIDKARVEKLNQNRSSYPHFPIMGREDWIEPVEGRRYAGYDFVDDRAEANEYCLLVLSLGYEPCHGSPTTSSASADAYASSSAALLLVLGWIALWQSP